MKSGFWMTDCFIGAVVVVPLWLLGLPQFSRPRFDGREHKAGDVGAQLSSRTRHDRIPSVAIDAMPIQFPARATGRDPDQCFRRGEEFAAMLHAAFAGSVGKAAISGGGVDISL